MKILKRGDKVVQSNTTLNMLVSKKIKNFLVISETSGRF